MDTKRSRLPDSTHHLFTLLLLTACGGAIGGGPEAVPESSAPNAPTGLSVTPLSGGAHLIWADNSEDEETFEIERKSGRDYLKIASLVFDTAQYHDADVVPGELYRYRVRAVRGAESSAYSNEGSILLAAEAPDAGVAPDPTEDGGLRPPPDGGSTGEDRGGTEGVSFRAQIVPILNRSCGTGEMTCHSREAYAGNPNFDCRGWLALEDLPLGSRNPNTQEPTGCPDRSLHQRLTELSAWMCDPTQPYLTAGRPEDSHLYNMIAGDPTAAGICFRRPGVPMTAMPPAASRFQIRAEDVILLGDWIRQGAEDN